MFDSFRRFVETHFGSVLIVSFLVGLFAPGLDHAPTSWLVPVLLAVSIYFSTSKATPDDFAHINYQQALIYVVVRFLILPIALYAIINPFFPSFSVPILLLALMPAGTSSGAMAAIMGANVGLALGITLVSSFLVPISVPLAFWFVGKEGITLDLSSLFWSLIKIVVLPILVYWQGTRRIPRVAAWSRQNASFFSIMLIGVMIVLVVAQRRAVLLDDPVYLAKAVIVACMAFAFFYAVGWWFPSGGNRRVRLAHTVVSGVMNNGLAISLALLYFPPEISLFMVLTEIPWTLGVALFRRLTRQENQKAFL